MWYKGYNFAPRNTDEVFETTETNKIEVFQIRSLEYWRIVNKC